jgi:dihydroxycyclohexadiene carboxylate dehydrogenase
MTHPDRFKDKVMIVTGAAQGIGRGVALAAARQGAQLVLADRSPLVHEVAQEAAACGAQVVTAEVDLETWAGAAMRAARALEDYGRIDILVNNVGGTIWAKPYQEYEADQIEAEIRRSLFPTLWCCRAVLPAMVAAQAGAIVNVSSVAGQIASGPYSAVKSFVTVFTEGLATELAGTGVTATALLPGFTHTEFHERAGVTMSSIPEFMWLDADKLVRDCLDDVAKGRVVSVPGAQYKAIVGALRVLPRGLVRSRARKAHRPKD